MNNIADLKIDKYQLKALAKNLHTLLKVRNISEYDLSQALNMPVMTVRRLVSGETEDPRISTLKTIADYLNVSIDSLMENHNLSAISLMNKNIPHFVPILDWKAITDIQSINDIDLRLWKEWYPIAIPSQTLSKTTFALESRPSMQPRFPMGTLFIIDPHETPNDRDVVLIKMTQDGTLSLRELIIDSPKWQLQPIIYGSESLFYNKIEHSIMGVIIFTIFSARKDLAIK